MFHLNEKQYIRFQTMFLCAFLFCFLMAGFHTGMWHEVFAAAVPEKTAASETEDSIRRKCIERTDDRFREKTPLMYSCRQKGRRRSRYTPTARKVTQYGECWT